MKSYRINRLRKSRGDVPPGFESLECYDEDSHLTELLVPAGVAQRQVQEIAPPEKAVAPVPAAPKTLAPAPPVDRKGEFHVTLPEEQYWREPAGASMAAVWDWEMLSDLVEHHNAGHGSADSQDRRRMTTMLRKMVSDGPWRPIGFPPGEDRDGLLRELRDELGHMPGLVDAVAASITRAATSGLPFRLGPLLLVGEPGTGKSYAARRLAEILGLQLRLIDMAAQQTNSYLHGSDKHWGNAAPGALFELLILGAHANPLIVLDEIDKAATRSNFDPLTPLYSALEASSAKLTKDMCIPATFDASHVSYIATANSLRGLPMPLLSRFELIHCVPPGPRESLQMARRVWDQVARKFALEGTPPRAVLVCLAEFPPRRMVQMLERAVARMQLAGRRQVALRDVEMSYEAREVH
jgi:ATP-dependent Lon protease